MPETKFKAKLSITRWTDGKGEGSICIEVTDDTSGCRVMDLEVDYATFAQAITGLSYLSCEGMLYHPDKVNLKQELMTVDVPVPSMNAWKLSREEKLAIVKPYEVDGWKAYHLDDIGNQHRRTANGYNVTFIRFVKEAE